MRRSRLKVDLIFHSFAVMRPTHISKKSIRCCTNLARQTTAILSKPDQFAPIDDGYPFLGAERSGLLLQSHLLAGPNGTKVTQNSFFRAGITFWDLTNLK